MEVCVDNVQSALAAARGGAIRIELCSSLSEGGLTPSAGLLRHLKKDPLLREKGIKIFCMIRPRGGDFLYSKQELEVMIEDIQVLRDSGSDGFVFGCLTSDGGIDKAACQQLIPVCAGQPMTFHRAFDMARTDEMDAHIKEIIDLGFKRILTSGTKVSALEGKHVIQRLQQSYGDKILIMPGAGINEDNLGEILRFTGVREFHGSAGMKQHSEMKFKNELFEGTNEYATKVTDEEKVKKMVGVFESIRK